MSPLRRLATRVTSRVTVIARHPQSFAMSSASLRPNVVLLHARQCVPATMSSSSTFDVAESTWCGRGFSARGLSSGPPPPSAVASSEGGDVAALCGAEDAQPADVPEANTNKLNPRKDLYMMFTCGRCDTRAVRGFSRQAYDNGVVIVTCPGCQVKHLVADRKGWFGEPGSIEDFLGEQGGEEVVRGSVDLNKDEDGTIEIDEAQLDNWVHTLKVNRGAGGSVDTSSGAATKDHGASLATPSRDRQSLNSAPISMAAAGKRSYSSSTATSLVKIIKSPEEFDTLMKGDKTVLVNFTASWCGPCRFIAPVFEGLAAKFPKVEFVKVDVDDLDEVAAKCGITAMPTFQVYSKGDMVYETRGADKAGLEKMVRAANDI